MRRSLPARQPQGDVPWSPKPNNRPCERRPITALSRPRAGTSRWLEGGPNTSGARPGGRSGNHPAGPGRTFRRVDRATVRIAAPDRHPWVARKNAHSCNCGKITCRRDMLRGWPTRTDFWPILTIPTVAKRYCPKERKALFFPRISEGGILLMEMAAILSGGKKRPKIELKGRFLATLAKTRCKPEKNHWEHESTLIRPGSRK
jgi:hypothetical protein